MAMSTNVDFYRKMKNLQEIQHESEQHRLQLDQQLHSYYKSDKRLAKLQATKLKNEWQRICDNEKKSRIRNEQLLRHLERVENNMATLSARTQRLRLKKKQYEEYIERLYPRWREQVLQRIEDRKLAQNQDRYAASPQHQIYSPPLYQQEQAQLPFHIAQPFNQSAYSMENLGQSAHSMNYSNQPTRETDIHERHLLPPREGDMHERNFLPPDFNNRQGPERYALGSDLQIPTHADVMQASSIRHPSSGHSLGKFHEPFVASHSEQQVRFKGNLQQYSPRSHIPEQKQVYGVSDYGYPEMADSQYAQNLFPQEPIRAQTDKANYSNESSLPHSQMVQKTRKEKSQKAKHILPDKSYEETDGAKRKDLQQQKMHSQSPRVRVSLSEPQENLPSRDCRPIEKVDEHDIIETRPSEIKEISAPIVKVTSIKGPTHSDIKFPSEMSTNSDIESDLSLPNSDEPSHLTSPRSSKVVPKEELHHVHESLPVEEHTMKQVTKPESLSSSSVHRRVSASSIEEASQKSEEVTKHIVLSDSGFIALLEAVEDDLLGADNPHDYYRTEHPAGSTRAEILRKANTGQSVSHLDQAVISMVVLEQLPLVLEEVEDGCLLSDKMLKLGNSFNTEMEVRTKIPSMSMNLWTSLYDHWTNLVKQRVMTPLELAQIFAPLLIKPGSPDTDKAMSLIRRILDNKDKEETMKKDSAESLPTPRCSSRQDKASPSRNQQVPPLKLDEQIQNEDSDDVFSDQKSPGMDLSQTAAYRNLLSGTMGSTKPPPQHDSDSDSLDNIEKQMSTMVSPRHKSRQERSQSVASSGGLESSSRRHSVRSVEVPSDEEPSDNTLPSSPGYVPTGTIGKPVSPEASTGRSLKSASSSKKPVAFRTGSDIETDSDFDLAVSTGGAIGQQSDEDKDDFDFYD